MRTFSLALLLTAFSFVSLFAAEGIPSDVDLQSQLVGEWSEIMSPAVPQMKQAEYTFRKDGTFSSFAVFSAGKEDVRIDIEGKWQIKDGILIEEITNSSHPNMVPVGAGSKEQVKSLVDGVLTYRGLESGKDTQIKKK